MMYNHDVYGYVNGKPVYSRDEFVYEARHFGPIDSDDDLLAFAEKVTHGWYHAGWKLNFIDYYLGDYGLDEPYHSLTNAEYARLKELQQEARADHKAAEDAREWKYIETIYWADNSAEDLWRDKDGNEKRIMVVSPHGDAC